MSQFETHKASRQGKAETLQRRTVRAVKYASSLQGVTRSGHVRSVKA